MITTRLHQRLLFHSSQSWHAFFFAKKEMKREVPSLVFEISFFTLIRSQGSLGSICWRRFNDSFLPTFLFKSQKGYNNLFSMTFLLEYVAFVSHVLFFFQVEVLLHTHFNWVCLAFYYTLILKWLQWYKKRENRLTTRRTTVLTWWWRDGDKKI